MDFATLTSGAVAALVTKLTKSDKWSHWVSLGYVVLAAFAASYAMNWGKLDVVAALTSTVVAITGHAVLLRDTPVGKALKWDVLAGLFQAVADLLKAIAEKPTTPPQP